jgi:hypothetical protein
MDAVEMDKETEETSEFLFWSEREIEAEWIYSHLGSFLCGYNAYLTQYVVNLIETEYDTRGSRVCRIR